MNLSQAIEHASAFVFPGFLTDDETLIAERERNEEAIGLLMSAWMAAPSGQETFSFDLVRNLADRNRASCDSFGIERLRDVAPATLARKLSDDDLVRGVAALQHRSADEVRRSAGVACADLGIAYTERPVSGTVCGIDIETTDRDPARGYIINVGLEFMDLSPKAKPEHPFSGYCGIPDIYADKGVPLAFVHHISWEDLEGKRPLRQNKKMQRAILAALEMYPYMAHNASFEDSWFMLQIDGYAEARKAGRVVPIDTRDICRRIDPEYKTLPHDSRPAALESWALRRGTLKRHQKETHLGLEDVDLMFRTVQAEFSERNMFTA
ncbi:DNA polymerase III subunit epsilon [Olsenella sp. HMSC062G07]|uniref:3'-5' exonuclease n=1 Tax=Olsenella sp. HMSC062G07 TaxID=1739330 RepID=UPI0008A50714|nr:DNA polymerase III subunit epsilon [Olsenella sp. HMSC062G07]OFK24796.1 DNA polymerase III subunit epsilon [Olsenella sp. HMSC062G07]